MAGMRENRVKKKLSEGKTATVVMGLNSPDVIEFFGTFGFDGMWIETEHAPTTWDMVAHQSRACDLWGMTSVCRVTTNDTSLITRTLDAGCTGIAVPHIRTKEDAEKAAKSAKFAPMGYRGMGGGRQSFGVTNYYHEANLQTLTVAFIEDIEAVENLQEILTVDNIDVFMVAPSDMAASMGYAWVGGSPAPAGVQEAIDSGIDQIVASGKTAGYLVSGATVPTFYERGVRFFLTSWRAWASGGAQQYQSVIAGLDS